MTPFGKLRSWFFQPKPEILHTRCDDGGRVLVVLIDGTLSSLQPGWQTNVGLTYQTLKDVVGCDLRIHYQPGIQWKNGWSGLSVLTGNGINRQICNAYGALATWYEPGDKIYFFGFSRGAYAVRSLAGVIEHVGLLRREHATERNVRQAYRIYRNAAFRQKEPSFRKTFCHDDVPIQAIGVWDTVKALGVRLPLIWRAFDHQHSFHTANLGASTRSGFQALALDETRVAYAPVMWEGSDGWTGTLQQMWFRGTHSDVGGQVRGRADVRTLSNIPLVWVLESLVAEGLPLPDGWRERFPQNAEAPGGGAWTGGQKFFLSRRRRRPLRFASESIHPTADGPRNHATSRKGA